jgi:hypothetical protein
MTQGDEQRTAQVDAGIGPRKRRAKVEPYHRAMLEAVVAGSSLEEAAQACGISRRTGQRWAQRHAGELKRARGELLDRALGEFYRELSVARATLHDLAADAGSAAADGANVRRGAARDLIDCFARLAQMGDLAERLNALEEAFAQRLPGSPLTAGHRLTLLTTPGA